MSTYQTLQLTIEDGIARLTLNRPEVLNAIDHRIGGALQLVIEAAGDEPPDNSVIKTFTSEDEARRPAFNAVICQRPVHALDDVAALTKRAQGGFCLVVNDPLPRANLMGEAEGFELAQPSNLQGMELVGLLARNRREVDDAGIAPVAGKLAVELGPAFGFDLPLEGAADVEIGAWSQFLGDEIARPIAGVKDAGTHDVALDLSDRAPGVYLLRLEGEDGAAEHKVVRAP